MLRELRATARVAALAAIAAGAAQAQTLHAWVDPTRGVDIGSLAIKVYCGTLAEQQPFNPSVTTTTPPPGFSPFLTIGAAIAAIQAASGSTCSTLSPANQGLVHLMPGIYSRTTNGESLPIVMRDNISLQGVGGALATVIIGDQLQPYATGPQILVDMVNGDAIAGIFVPNALAPTRSVTSEVIFDGSFLTDANPEMIDGITVRGGDVQFYIETELEAKAWTISNCVLDMLDLAPVAPGSVIAPIQGPTFGVLQVSDYTAGSPPYQNIQTNFVHNTVIMVWYGQNQNAPLALSRPDAVGICDATDSLTIYGGTFNPVDLTNSVPIGQSELLIAHNIFRTEAYTANLGLPVPVRFAMLGIDDTDTSIGNAPANAFDPRRVGAGNGSFSSAVTNGALAAPGLPAVAGNLPRALIDVNPLAGGTTQATTGIARDPGFVGEFVNRRGTSAQDSRVRDWRLLPSSVYIDRGTALTPVGGGFTGLSASNGATLTIPQTSSGLLNSFDWDGEGSGNRRFVPSPLNPAATALPDLGFDEVNLFIQTRSYANDSLAHNNAGAAQVPPQTPPSYPAGVGIGQAQRSIIFPSAGVIDVFLNSSTIIISPPVPVFASWPGLLMPGDPSFPAQVFAAPHIYPPIPVTGLTGLPVPAEPPYLAPFENLIPGFAGNTFGHLTYSAPNGPASLYLAWQLLYTNPTGLWITNTQCEIF